jgi:hypothetical protein
MATQNSQQRYQDRGERTQPHGPNYLGLDNRGASRSSRLFAVCGSSGPRRIWPKAPEDQQVQVWEEPAPEGKGGATESRNDTQAESSFIR